MPYLNIKLISYLLLVFIIHTPKVLRATSYNVTVSKDGTGDYISIQAAIDAAPDALISPYIIFIKNGAYNEKIFIEKNFITLIGESRENTRIETAILRRIWRETHSDDWGVATINIADDVTDLTLANLTIVNNFAELNPDVPDNTDHTMAIRGGGHRIKIVNCNVIATGGDTLSLWNTDGGMFYHANCYFEGYVDFVCPRGYCYIEDCNFYGHNSNATIWHDGSGGEDHKLVIRKSSFDGIKNFGLGRFHRMSAFYLLNCDFSKNMRDRNIFYAGDSLEQDRDKLIYGERIYYHNCHGQIVDYNWHPDNLNQAKNAPDPDTITPAWTFQSAWNPVAELADLIPFAMLPSPDNHAKNQLQDIILSWHPGKDAVAHNVYFGISDNPEFAGTNSDTMFDPGTLDVQTIYYWRVDEITDTDTIRGTVWKFSTLVNEPPAQSFNPVPTHNSYIEDHFYKLSWNFVELGTDSFLLYFDTVPSPALYKRTTIPEYYVYDLTEGQNYYWKVDTKNSYGITEGELWKFSRGNAPTRVKRHPIENGRDFSIVNYYSNSSGENIFIDLTLPRPDDIVIRLYDTRGNLLDTSKRYVGNCRELIDIDVSSLSQSQEQFVLGEIRYNNDRRIFKVRLPN